MKGICKLFGIRDTGIGGVGLELEGLDLKIVVHFTSWVNNLFINFFRGSTDLQEQSAVAIRRTNLFIFVKGSLQPSTISTTRTRGHLGRAAGKGRRVEIWAQEDCWS